MTFCSRFRRHKSARAIETLYYIFFVIEGFQLYPWLYGVKLEDLNILKHQSKIEKKNCINC